MKKIIALILCAVMLLSLCACGNSNRAPEPDNSAEAMTETASEDIENGDLSEDEINVIVANAIYDEIIRRQGIRYNTWPPRLNSKIDAGQCSFNISKIERGYRDDYTIYGNGYFCDVYGKICANYSDGSGYGDYTFTVTISSDREAKCEIA